MLYLHVTKINNNSVQALCGWTQTKLQQKVAILCHLGSVLGYNDWTKYRNSSIAFFHSLFFQLTCASPSGLHVNITNSDGFSPLHMAAMFGHVTLVELFLKRGANIDARSSKRECTALHLACQNNRQFTHKVGKSKVLIYLIPIWKIGST